MSNAEPSRGGPGGSASRRAAIAIAVVALFAQLLLVATPGVVLGAVAHRVAEGAELGRPGGSGGGSGGGAGTGSGSSSGSNSSDDKNGASGAGDPDFPDYGAGGYDAVKYLVDVSWDPGSAMLTGHTTIRARALQELRSFSVDLALTASAVRVDSKPASFHKSGFQDLTITPRTPIAAGAVFTATIDYAGRPANIKRGSVAPFTITGDEALVAGEPESSAWWYPSNDHPSDPALFELYAHLPTGWQAISIGRLAGTAASGSAESGGGSSRGAGQTWHWISEKPSATYLTFLAIGHFALHQGVADGRPFVYAVSMRLSAGDRRAAFAQLVRTPAVIKVLETMFGPYPFGEIGGIVPGGRLWFDGLESQTRPVYAASAMTRGDASQLLSHELTHMWFGDNVTVSQWNDIFDNEAWASWGAWTYAELTGGRSAAASFTRLYDRAAPRADFWRISLLDPGPDHLFDVVYYRGPMALQALRNRMGDQAFLAMARSWAQRPGARSLAEWMVQAQSFTSVDLAPFFRAWIIAPTAPARTSANGFS